MLLLFWHLYSPTMEGFFLLLKLFFDNFIARVTVTLNFSYFTFLNTLFLPTNSFPIFMSLFCDPFFRTMHRELGGFTSVYMNEDNDYISPRLFQKSAVVGPHEPLFHPPRTIQGAKLGQSQDRRIRRWPFIALLTSFQDLHSSYSFFNDASRTVREGGTAVLFGLST